MMYLFELIFGTGWLLGMFSEILRNLTELQCKKFSWLSKNSIIFFFLFFAISSKQLSSREHPVILVIFQIREVLLENPIENWSYWIYSYLNSILPPEPLAQLDPLLPQAHPQASLCPSQLRTFSLFLHLPCFLLPPSDCFDWLFLSLEVSALDCAVVASWLEAPPGNCFGDGRNSNDKENYLRLGSNGTAIIIFLFTLHSLKKWQWGQSSFIST